MTHAEVRPFGEWKSPITSDFVVEKTVSFSDLKTDGDTLYWNECRPSEGGRYVVVQFHQGKKNDLIPQGFNARTRVHEYGGASYGVRENVLYFTNFKDQAIYKISDGNEPIKISNNQQARYADYEIDLDRNVLFCIREEHLDTVKNSVIKINDAGQETTLVEGNDFYSSPRMSPDGRWLAYICWNHPNMPWDLSELWLHPIHDDGTLGEGNCIAKQASIMQPQWSSDGVLHFISDQSGYWNLYAWINGEIKALCTKKAEFSPPPWVMGNASYCFWKDFIVCSYFDGENDHLALLKNGQLTEIDLAYQTIHDLQLLGNSVVFFAGAYDRPNSIIKCDLSNRKAHAIVVSRETSLDPGYLSRPELICYPGHDNLPTYAFYYPPKNKDFVGSKNEKPPLIVKSHGGPSSHVQSSLNFGIQYWTSRGFAFVDVNYGGSTGYGREYRERLKGKWGIVDIEDCTKAALYLSKKDLADPKRLIIKGGSAGGYTTLAALTFTDVFQAGASYYGVSDLGALVEDTHKFESRYLEGLIGKYPEEKNLYEKRSPIYHTDKLSGAIILLQGDEDKIVPPSQAEKMFDVLKEKGYPTSYVLLKGEQHGFRKAENIKKALESEYYFYTKVFHLNPSDKLPTIQIENLK